MERIQPKGDEAFWAITSYFNPLGYKSRRENYRTFCQRLDIPLLTVEWSPYGRFELRPHDADILIQLAGGDILWQKERLLNVALQSLPACCANVAWLDCDIVFDNPDWVHKAEALLEDVLLVQLFDGVVDLPNGMLPDAASRVGLPPCGMGDVARASITRCALPRLRPNRLQSHRLWLSGLAWAARRDRLQAHGFYDVCVVGGGDRVMSCAFFGQLADAANVLRMNASWADHFLQWARAVHADLQGAVAYVPGRLFHLWHGDLRDRYYGARRKEFSQFDFDPRRDLALAEQGSWRWNSSKPLMHEYVRRYFEARREDGVYPGIPPLYPAVRAG